MELISKKLKEMDDINQNLLEEKGIFKSNRLFKCILGLNELESNVLAYLLNNSDVGTNELSEKLHMDRSSIQRVLQNLDDLNIIKRKSMSLKDYSEAKKLKGTKKRGYLYVYNARKITYIKKELKNLLNEWYESMKIYIDNLESLFECFETDGELCSELRGEKLAKIFRKHNDCI